MTKNKKQNREQKKEKIPNFKPASNQTNFFLINYFYYKTYQKNQIFLKNKIENK